MKPCDGSPSSWSSGTNISWKAMPTVSDARCPILSSFFPTEYPSVSVGTMKAPIPLAPRRSSAASVRTMVTTTSPKPPLVTQALAPFRIHPPSTLRALGSHPRGVGAGVGLGERKGAQHLPARHGAQPALLLRVGAVGQDHLRGERVVHAHRHGHGGVAARDLFQRDHVGQGVQRQPVVLLGEQHPQKAQLAQLLDDLAGKVRLAVPLLGVGPQLVLGELARQVADLLLFLGHRQSA